MKKKNINYEKEILQYRITKVRNLLQKQNLDGILLINGTDGCSNEQNGIFLNWLLNSNAGNLIKKDFYLNPSYSETIFLITKKKIKFFLSKKIMEKYFEKIILCGDRKIEIFTENEIEKNRDDFEIRKMEIFMNFIYGEKKLGILLDGKENKQELDDVEKWPLIQLYGLDGIGKGFFSLDKNLIDLSFEMNNLYNFTDLASLEFIYESQILRMEENFDLVYKIISDSNQKKRLNISEFDLNLSLSQIYEMSLISLNSSQNCVKNNKKSLFTKNPFIKFGKYTSLEKTQKSSTENLITNSSHFENQGALHFNIEDFCPISGLRCSRSYFLTANNSQNFYPSEIKNNEDCVIGYNLKSDKDNIFSDEFKLSTYYLKMAQLYFKLIDKIKNGMQFRSLKKFKNLLLEKLEETDKKMGKKIVLKHEIELKIGFYDNFGNETNLDDFITNLNVSENIKENFNITKLLKEKYIFVIKIEIDKIQSYINFENMGKLIIGDTFFLFDDKIINLTRKINYFDFFQTRLENSEKIKKMKDLFAKNLLGERLYKNCENIKLYIPMKKKVKKFGIDNKILKINLSWFEKGFKILCEKFGNFLILEKNIKNILIFNDMKNSCLIFELEEPIFFKKFAQKFFILKFENFSKTNIFYPYKEWLLKNNKKFEILEKIPENLIFNKKSENEFIMENLIDYFKTKYIYFFKMRNYDDFHFSKFSVLLNEEKNDKIMKNENLEILGENGKFEILIFVGDYLKKKNILENFSNLSYQKKKDLIEYQQNDDFLNKNFEDDFFNFLKNLKISKNEKKIILVNLPQKLNYQKIVQKLQNENFVIKGICSVLNYEPILKNNFSDQNLKNFLIRGYISFCIFFYEENNENLENNFYKLKKIYSGTNFGLFKKNRITKNFLEEILNYENFVSKKNQILRNLTNSDFEENDYQFLKIKFPVEKKIFENFLKNLLNEKNGIFTLENYKEKKKIDDIEKEIEILKKKVFPLRKLDEKKGVIIKSIKGYIRFKEELDKIYFFSFSKNNFILKKKKEKISYKKIILEDEIYYKFEKEEKIQIGILLEKQKKNNFVITEKNFGKNFLEEENFGKKISKKLLTKKNIFDIQKEYCEWNLIDGDIYDGFLWRNAFGDIYKEHPRKEELIDYYVFKFNKDIDDLIKERDDDFEKLVDFYKED